MRQGRESRQAWQGETSASGFWSLLSFNLGISGLVTGGEVGNREGSTERLGNPSRGLRVGRKFLLFLLSLQDFLLCFKVDFVLL